LLLETIRVSYFVHHSLLSQSYFVSFLCIRNSNFFSHFIKNGTPFSPLSSSQHLHHEENILKKAKGASKEGSWINYSEFFVKEVNSKTPP